MKYRQALFSPAAPADAPLACLLLAIFTDLLEWNAQGGLGLH